MSHPPERKEKDCLNCGTIIVGKYCHACGQENVEPKETVWQLLSHFFNDITHFDGKVFMSMKKLILKPGFLSKEYMRGKRASYLNPIRMYLFTSFVFFLIFFSLYKGDESDLNAAFAKSNNDSLDLNTLKQISEKLDKGKIRTKGEYRRMVEDTTGKGGFTTNFRSRAEVDSLTNPAKKPPGWLERQLAHKIFEINEKYRYNPRALGTNFINTLLHFIPQMLFVLLPLFALYLKLLHIRNKNYDYTDHAMFTIHLYIFIFLDMLVIFGISKLEGISGINWLKYVNIVFMMAIYFYMYKAMRNFYRQKRGKTILKFLLLNFSFLLTSILLLMVFVFLALIRI